MVKALEAERWLRRWGSGGFKGTGGGRCDRLVVTAVEMVEAVEAEKVLKASEAVEVVKVMEAAVVVDAVDGVVVVQAVAVVEILRSREN